MLIVWGKKRTRRKQGYIAEFCPYCRELQAMELIRIGLVSHLYGLSIGAGEEVRHEAHCLECKGFVETNAENYLAPAKTKGRDLHQLVMESNPDILDRHRDRFETEAIILTSPHKLDPELRAQLIAEPFERLAWFAEETLEGPTHIDRHCGIALLLTFIAIFGFLIPVSLRGDLGTSWSIQVICAIGGAGFLAMIYFYSTANRRRVGKLFVPYLLRALTPLQPTLEEIQTAMEPYSNVAIGKHIKPEVLIDRSQSILRISR